MADVFPDIGTPEWGLTESSEEDIQEIELGDGYKFSQPNGINYQKSLWEPSWNLDDKDTAKAAYAWLMERKRITPFLWNHPDGVVYKVRCNNVKLAHDGFNDYTLSASFAQDFNPI